jgi:NAD-reducing hydrogenase small subunit
MSILDIDERILDLIELVDFDKSPIDDIKEFTQRCAVGLIEGGCCNEENVAVLRRLPRELRHPHLDRRLRDPWAASPPCATRSRSRSASTRRTSTARPCTTRAARSPTIPELPLLLDKVYPCHEVVKIDYHLPGCPPPADTLWAALTALLTDKPVELPYELLKYD